LNLLYQNFGAWLYSHGDDYIYISNAFVVQLDRIPDFGSGG
jgi:hypothetical protein